MTKHTYEHRSLWFLSQQKVVRIGYLWMSKPIAVLRLRPCCPCFQCMDTYNPRRLTAFHNNTNAGKTQDCPYGHGRCLSVFVNYETQVDQRLPSGRATLTSISNLVLEAIKIHFTDVWPALLHWMLIHDPNAFNRDTGVDHKHTESISNRALVRYRIVRVSYPHRALTGRLLKPRLVPTQLGMPLQECTCLWSLWVMPVSKEISLNPQWLCEH